GNPVSYRQHVDAMETLRIDNLVRWQHHRNKSKPHKAVMNIEIKSEQDITGQVAAELRKAAGLKQVEFWSSVGYKHAGAGYTFENSRRALGIPKPVRILIFLKYVAGLPIDVSTAEEAATVVKYGGIMNA